MDYGCPSMSRDDFPIDPFAAALLAVAYWRKEEWSFTDPEDVACCRTIRSHWIAVALYYRARRRSPRR